MALGDYKRVTWVDRVEIEKRRDEVILVYNARWCRPRHDVAEDATHSLATEDCRDPLHFLHRVVAMG